MKRCEKKVQKLFENNNKVDKSLTDGEETTTFFVRLAQEKEIERFEQNQTNRHDDYKTKWENAEAQCRQWEKKFEVLENETIKPLKEKIDQLERDYHQMKVRRRKFIEFHWAFVFVFLSLI